MTRIDEQSALIAMMMSMSPLILMAFVVWSFIIVRFLKSHWDEMKRNRINAKFDKYLAKPNIKRAPSSICEERLALNQKVPGSNPGGLTIIGSGESDVKRRIWWHLNDRTAIAMSDADLLPTKFSWRDLPRNWEDVPGKPNSRQTRDFKPEEHKVQLLWDGMQTDTFLDEVVLKHFIIRLVYMLDNSVLVPSELLADANLVYKDDWVDQWGCLDNNDEIIECPREIYRPKGRNIQIMRGKAVHNSGPSFVHAPRNSRIAAKIDRREIPAVVEVPDEKCFFSFRAGGFYEKGQKPLKDACEKGEKAV
jgi:hypothetical protein